MKIDKSSTRDLGDGKFEITFVPNWIESIFGIRPITKKYADTGRYYIASGRTVFVDEDGERLHSWHRVTDEIYRFKDRKLFF